MLVSEIISNYYAYTPNYRPAGRRCSYTPNYRPAGRRCSYTPKYCLRGRRCSYTPKYRPDAVVLCTMHQNRKKIRLRRIGKMPKSIKNACGAVEAIEGSTERHTEGPILLLLRDRSIPFLVRTNFASIAIQLIL